MKCKLRPSRLAAEYVPVSQLVQALAPEEGQYLPWVHSVQLLDEAEEDINPAEHEMPWVHSVQLLDEKALHVPVNPLPVNEPSDVKVTLRKPVVDV